MTHDDSIHGIELGYRGEAKVLDMGVFDHNGKKYLRLIIDRNVGMGICEFVHLDTAKASLLVDFLNKYIDGDEMGEYLRIVQMKVEDYILKRQSARALEGIAFPEDEKFQKIWRSIEELWRN